MKRLHLCLLSTFLLATLNNSLFAVTRTVSNNPNIPAQFSSLQTAINESAAGDTLLVHGSPNSYGDVTILKSLVIIGQGYRPQGQNQLLSTINNVSVRADNAGDVDNLVLLGINVNGLFPHNGISCGQGFAVKIRMERCILSTMNPRVVAQGPNTSEFSAEQCIFTSTFNGQQNFCNGPGLASVLISNSIFIGTFAYSDALSNGVVVNCMFLGGSSALGPVQNTIFGNNIFYGTQLSAGNGAKTGCVFNNNLTFGTNLNSLVFGSSTTSGTLEEVNPLFVSTNPPANGQSYTALFNGSQNFNLQESSPAIAAGSDGGNLGTTGGTAAFDYLLQGTAKGPFMTSLIISNATLPENGTLQVQFGAKVQD